MASVTGFTADRMLEIENNTVVGGSVDANGHLILTKHDASTIDAGKVSGTTFQVIDTLDSFAAASAAGIHRVSNAQTDGPIANTWFMCQTTLYLNETVWNQQEAWSPFGSSTQPDTRRWMRQMYGNDGNAWTPWREITPVAPGNIMIMGGTEPPSGWLKCQGQAVGRATYPALFAAIGTLYGVGDGSTTFNLPNIQGRVPVGANGSDANFNAIGKTGGESTHTLTLNEMPGHSHGGGTGWENQDHTHGFPHTHTTPATATGTQSANHTHSLPIANTQQSASISAGPNGYTVTAVAGTSGANSASHTHTLPAMTTDSQSASTSWGISANHNHNINAEGSNWAHNNLQPYICFDYIIKT